MDDIADGATYADSIALAAREGAPGTVIVEVGGELDMATVPVVDEFVRRRLGGRVLVLDLTGVTFLGSTGLNLLIGLRAACDATGTALRLVAGSKAVLKPLELTDLTDHFAIHDTVVDAS